MESSETSFVCHQTKPAPSSQGICWWLLVGTGTSWGLNWLGLRGCGWGVGRARIPDPQHPAALLENCQAYSCIWDLLQRRKQQHKHLLEHSNLKMLTRNPQLARLSASSWIHQMLLSASAKFSSSSLSLPLCWMGLWAQGIQRRRGQGLGPEDLTYENVSVGFSRFLDEVCRRMTVLLLCFLLMKPPTAWVPTGLEFRTKRCFDDALATKDREMQGNKGPY